jgi:enoyl-CoA hydratase
MLCVPRYHSLMKLAAGPRRLVSGNRYGGVRLLLEVSQNDRVQTWRMNFPPVNAINAESLRALGDAVASAAAEPEIAAVVLTSGSRVFSAGADAGEMARAVAEFGPEGLVDQFNQTMDIFREVCIAIRRSPFLVIAAINGHALAGGLELAAACDLRFAADVDKIQIGVPEMDLFGALPTGGGGAQFIARLMGPSRALQFMLSAKPVSPRMALDMGLVDRLCSAESLIEEAEGFAAEVAAKAGRIGVSAAKRAVLTGVEMPLMNAMEFDRSVHWDNMRRGNFRAGAASFVAKFG